ncbi:hypothetical protein H9Y04_29905 [Streptomyces sp. TRM66268-LWL]|uniref:Lipoprotein n=1 Tax=Streptomyces polyasparticus TaxID=2767826 RepID=A0ABR7SQF8_9ACTN|nr:hypothetical protein [Streptomyces polyasparticus]MBC9716756.1 hypothetical protein [Streptomyces polyasparticus]
MRRTVLTTAGLALSAALALTACGSDSGSDSASSGKGKGSDKTVAKNKEPFADASGPEIADRAIEATAAAKSLRVKGTVPDADLGTITLDMAMDTQGVCAGSMSVGGQGKADIVNDGKTVYMKYDEAFLRAQGKGEPKADVDAAVDMLGNRWVKTSATGEGAEDLAAFCDLDQLLGEFKSGDSAARKGKVTTVDGQEAITLTENDGGERYTIYVATKGKPYLLKLTSDAAKDGENLTFTDYDKPVDAKAPSGDVLDLDKM